MDLGIYTVGQPILSEKCNEVNVNMKEEVTFLINGMFDTLRTNIGVGLSAPQVGKKWRVFVIDAMKMFEYYPECFGFKKVFINPVIKKYSRDTSVENEGCLSIPGVLKEVRRSNRITVEYLDENFEKHKDKFNGFIARIIQHECDHLDGKLMTEV